ncbi:MAG: hypothetical protein M3333_05000 [Actinomycetota bacterium]|nr:hypothetical protein [Actinomycetota bacterium]
MRTTVRPLNSAYGGEGIPVRGNRTLPFSVTREWSAPAGRYVERWFLVDPATRTVVFEGPIRDEVLIWGLQALSSLTDRLMNSFTLEPGPYLLVFALGGHKGAEVEVEAVRVAGEPA